MLAPIAVLAAPTLQDRSASATLRPPTRSAADPLGRLCGDGDRCGGADWRRYLLRSVRPLGLAHCWAWRVDSEEAIIDEHTSDDCQAACQRTTATTSSPPTTSQPTSYAGYQIVAGCNGQRSYPTAAGHLTRW
jgi:hypothetical protein